MEYPAHGQKLVWHKNRKYGIINKMLRINGFCGVVSFPDLWMCDMFGHGSPVGLQFLRKGGLLPVIGWMLSRLTVALLYAQNFAATPFTPPMSSPVVSPIAAAPGIPQNEPFNAQNSLQNRFRHGLCRLNISWGGGSPQFWAGEIRLSEGEFCNLSVLGTEPDVPGSVWLENGRVRFQSTAPKYYSGIYVTAETSRTAQISVHIIDRQNKTEQSKTFILADILNQGQQQPIDAQGNVIVVERIPNDEISVELPEGKTVIPPGSLFRMNVLPRFLAIPWEKGLVLDVAVYRCRTEECLQQMEFPISEPEMFPSPKTIPVQIEFPREEGAFDVVLTVQQKTEARLMRQGKTRVLSQRMIQCYAVSPNYMPPPPTPIKQDYRESLVETIDTQNPAWWKRFAKMPTLPKVGNSYLGKIPSLSLNLWEKNSNNNWPESLSSGHIEPYQRQDRQFSHFSLLKPSDDPGVIPWQAYIVPVQEPGKPHFMEIEYISDVPQTLGISLIEPGPNGGVNMSTLDSGINVTEQMAHSGERAHVLQHRILFWPRTTDPMVLLSNRRTGKPAVFGEIKVYKAPEDFPSAVSANPMGTHRSRRLFAAYYHRPMFCENFSATRVSGLGEPSRMEVSDWKTFHEGIHRLIQYLRMVGYGAVMMSVASDGSALYPSDLLMPTPRYDSGIFLKSGEDPVRKDVLEVIAAKFDRENIVFIPAVDFNAPLPNLERRIRENQISRQPPQETGLTWIGPNGNSITEQSGTNFGRAPYYNTLHPQVQEEMLAVIRELVRRTAAHPSFGGIAIQLAPDGYAMLPDENWGMDDHTFNRFLRECRLDLQAQGTNRFAERAEFVRQHHRETWIQWRAGQLAAFYKEVRKIVSENRPDAKLYLAGARMFEGPKYQRMFAPSLTNIRNVYPALQCLGLDPAAFQEDADIVFLRPEKVAANDSLRDSALAMELSQGNIAQVFSFWGSSRGSLFYHSPIEGTIPGFDTACPFQPSRSWFYTEPSPGHSQNRARFVRHLADSDTFSLFDGGRMLLMGEEDSLRDMISQFQMLPPVPFKTFQPKNNEHSLQPLTLRYLNTENGTYCYLVNTAPFSVPVRVGFSAQQGCRIIHNAFRPLNAPQVVNGGFRWSETLQPHDFIAMLITDPKAEPLQVEVSRPAEICGPEGQIHQQINDLIERVNYTRRTGISWNVLSNPGFDAALPQPEEPVTSSGNTFFSKPRASIGSLFQHDGKKTASQDPVKSPPSNISGWTSFGDSFQADLDHTAFRNGNASLRMTATQSAGVSAGGVVSEMFAPPRTGRLFITVWVGIQENASELPLRMTLTGKINEQDYSSTADIGPAIWSQISQVQPVNGVRWHYIVIPFYDLPLSGFHSLQLRFELLHDGVVWLDNVQLYQLAFFSEAENRALMQLVSVAAFRLNKDRISEALAILDGYWPRLLQECLPDVEQIQRQKTRTQTAEVKKTAETPPTDQEKDKKDTPSGFLGRVKQWLPDWR
jgi:hypothetical protein